MRFCRWQWVRQGMANLPDRTAFHAAARACVQGSTWNRLVVKIMNRPLAREVTLTPGRALKVKCTSAKQVWPAGQAVSSPPAACCSTSERVSHSASWEEVCPAAHKRPNSANSKPDKQKAAQGIVKAVPRQ